MVKKMDVLRTTMLLNVYDELAKKTLELLEKYKDDQLVASTLVAQGLKVYKSILSEQEFNDMLKIIVDDAHKIKPFFEFIIRVHWLWLWLGFYLCFYFFNSWFVITQFL